MVQTIGALTDYCRVFPSRKPFRNAGKGSSCKPASLNPPARRRRRRTSLPAKLESEYELTSEVENVDRNYCDDFVCTSSPAVEQTVKAFAVDIQRCSSWTTSRFMDDVTYKDPYRSFTGRSKYSRKGWVQTNVQTPRAVVSRLRMKDKGTALVDWRLTGKIAVLDIDVGCESTIKLNLLTGQITNHSDEWDLSKCSFPSKLAFIFSRLTWAAQESSKDTQDQVDKISQSLGSMDEEGDYYPDPTDPTKFFQESDTFKQDAISIAAFLALIYALYKGYSTIFTSL